MGYVIPAGYSRVTLHYGSESPLGSQIVTGFGINQGPSPTVLDIAEEWWTESLRLVTSELYTLDRIEARNDVEYLERAVGEAGLREGEMLPPNNAALVNLSSGLVGKKNRGRMYLPGVLTEADVASDGTIDGGLGTSLQGVMNYLGALVQDAGKQIVILHSTVGTPTMVIDASVAYTIATQRRRLRR